MSKATVSEMVSTVRQKAAVGFPLGAAWHPPGEETPKILLIDEASDSHAALERIAIRMTALVHHARNVADALRCAMKFSYDALIVDATLEGETSLPLLEQLSAMQPTAAILVSGQG